MIVKLRDNRYWIHGTVAGKFLRLPLGTSNENAAKVTVDHIERAWAEGATSLRWPELKNILPPKTFDAVAKIGNYREPDPKAAAPPPKTWDDLERVFLAKLELLIQTKDRAESTRERYQQTLRAFSEYLKETGVYDLPSIATPFVERFKLWRLAKIQEKKISRVDVALLSILLSRIEHLRSLSSPNWLPKIRWSLTDGLEIPPSTAHIPSVGTSSLN